MTPYLLRTPSKSTKSQQLAYGRCDEDFPIDSFRRLAALCKMMQEYKPKI